MPQLTKCLQCGDLLIGDGEKSDGVCARCMARRIRVAVEQGYVDWDHTDHRVIAGLARRAVKRLNDSGDVREAYYKIHDNVYPVIYAIGTRGVLENVRMTIRCEEILSLITKA